MSETKEVTISIEEYKELLQAKQKYEQCKQFMINNSSNKTIEFIKAIERKNLWDIIEENKKESEVK